MTIYGHVDTAYLDAARATLAAAKQRAFDLLHLKPGMTVLEVGCGPATDTIALAGYVGPTGQVAGIDHDPGMIAEATARTEAAGLTDRVTYQVADAGSLPFESDTFDATRSERVFQHLPDPDAALTEMVRVTKPGGRVQIFDNDWGANAFDSTEPELVERIRRFMIDQRLIANPLIGRTLYRRFRAAGLDDVRVELVPLRHDVEVVRQMLQSDKLKAITLQAGVISEEEARRLDTALDEAAANGTLFVAGLMMLAIGTKP